MTRDEFFLRQSQVLFEPLCDSLSSRSWRRKRDRVKKEAETKLVRGSSSTASRTTFFCDGIWTGVCSGEGTGGGVGVTVTGEGEG